MSMHWHLRCLLCGQYESTSLTEIQEHAMAAHHYRQDALREQTRRQITPDHYVFSMPDGREWLDAARSASE
jgi:hypothetical protein